MMIMFNTMARHWLSIQFGQALFPIVVRYNAIISYAMGIMYDFVVSFDYHERMIFKSDEGISILNKRT